MSHLRRIARATKADLTHRVALRQLLRPEGGAAAHREGAMAQAAYRDHLSLLARPVDDAPVGLAEATVRLHRGDGRAEPPVLFLEGLLVAPSHRRRGVARALGQEVARQERGGGLAQSAPDADANRSGSHAPHRAPEFAEIERVIFFRRLSASTS